MSLEEIIKETEKLNLEERKKLFEHLVAIFFDEDEKKKVKRFLKLEDILEKEVNNIETTEIKLKYSGAEDLGEIDMENLRDDIYNDLLSKYD